MLFRKQVLIIDNLFCAAGFEFNSILLHCFLFFFCEPISFYILVLLFEVIAVMKYL